MIITEYLNNYLKSYKHYKDYWNYEDGCVLIGCQQLFSAENERKYIDFVIKYLDPLIDNDGVILNYDNMRYNIDSFNAGKVLFPVYDFTGQKKYRYAIDYLMHRLKDHPRTSEGNFYHKSIYPDQVWLDGLYMAQPFYMEYETRYNGKANYDDILNQFRNVRKHMYDPLKKLYYHGYDAAGVQAWADKSTGLSSNFWLRSMGWYLMSLIDIIDIMSKEKNDQYMELSDFFHEAIDGVLMYQDKKTKLFYQVIDRCDDQKNYTETSGSAMISYAILKAVRLGVLKPEKYLSTGIEIFDSIVNEKIKTVNGVLSLTDICFVAGLGPGEERNGSVEYYLSEKRVSDDPKGVGPFIMAYAQKIMLENCGYRSGFSGGNYEKK